MKTYTITVSGRTMPDIEAAIHMVGTAITFDEQQQGMDSSESLSYAFKSSGEFDTQEVIAALHRKYL